MNGKNTLRKNIREIFRFTEKFSPIIFCCIVSLFFFSHEYNRPTLKTENDILTLKGNITEYSFTNEQNLRNTSRKYYFKLDKFNCKFQIKADYIGYFYQSKFEQSFIKNLEVKISIPKVDEIYLNNENEQICILSLEDENRTYLDKKDTLKNENSHFDLKAGIFFIFFGIILNYFRNKRKIK